MAYKNLQVDETDVEYAPFNSKNKDRVINADHLARWLSSVNSDGVARQLNEFEASISSGMNVVINTGIGHVAGHHLYLKAPITIPVDTSVSGDRIDTFGFRWEVENRRTFPYYNMGEVGSGVAPTPRNDNQYVEIPLYNIHVKKDATSLTRSDLEDVRTYVVSSATYFKKYNQSHETTTTTTSLKITTPYNNSTDTVDIYVNGIAMSGDKYSIDDTGLITFKGAIYSGNEIQLSVWHFQDGTGTLDSVVKLSDRVTEVERTTSYYYHCTGTNDNIALSKIAQDFLTASGDYAGINANAQMEIIVCGNCGVSTQYSGTGTQANPYVYFAFGRSSSSTRTIYFNFSNCSQINIACRTTANTYNTIFDGADINIRNCRMNVTSGYNVDVFFGTNIHCQDSEFWMTTTGTCCVGRCCGFFENVRTSITSTNGNAYCFYSNGNLTKIIGGTHYAWTASSSAVAVCFYVIDAAANNENVLFISMANMPQSARSGYYQTDTVEIHRGYATIMSNAMWKAVNVYDYEKCIAYGNVILSKN